LGDDEPLPQEVLDAIRFADREDGDAEQVARLEARLAPMFAAPPQAVDPRSTPSSSLPQRGPLATGKLLTAGLALVGAAVLVWPGRPHVQRAATPARPAAAAVQQPAMAVAAPSASHLSSANNPAFETAAPTEARPSAQATAAVGVGLDGSARATARSDDGSAHIAPQNSLALEARLLSRARRELANDPAQALQLTERHRLRFPHGVLSEEREVIAIKALSRMGKQDAAQARQERFMRQFPDSPHAGKLDATSSAGEHAGVCSRADACAYTR
jgi:hypothetical protein